MMLLEESDMSHPSVSPSLFHNTSSSPTVLVASTTPHDKANTMSTSGFDVCHNFQRGSCSYGSRCKFVHGANDLRPRPPNSSSTTQGRCGLISSIYVFGLTHTYGVCLLQDWPKLHATGLSYDYPNPSPAHPIAFGPTGPLQQAKFEGFIPMAQAGPPGPTTPTVASQFPHPGGMVFPQYAMSPSHLPQATMLPQAFQTMTLQQPNWNMDTGASSYISENVRILDLIITKPNMKKKRKDETTRT
ncbi:Toll/interleukin-1 receptor domain-containing protein [Tanacetum coccineum]